MAYRPFTGNRFYPGLISEERQAKLQSYDFALAELSADDLVWQLSKAVAATAYSALRFVLDKFGQAAAEELAREFGNSLASSGMSREWRSSMPTATR